MIGPYQREYVGSTNAFLKPPNQTPSAVSKTDTRAHEMDHSGVVSCKGNNNSSSSNKRRRLSREPMEDKESPATIRVDLGQNVTLVMASIFRGHCGIAMGLLESPAVDPNDATEKGITALHVAALKDRWRVVQRLVERGAHIDAVDDRGNTALHIAAKVGSRKALAALLGLGANHSVRDARGSTLLHLLVAPTLEQFATDYAPSSPISSSCSSSSASSSSFLKE